MTVFRSSWCLGAVLLSAASVADFGDPLTGLTPDDAARYAAGKQEFATAESVAEGLGPVFNGASCGACHRGPGDTVGGSNQRLETRFGRYRADGTFDPLTELGGSLLQDHGIGAFNGVDFVGEVVPPNTVTAQRRTTPLFGLGMVDATPASTFHTLALVQAFLNPTAAGTPSSTVPVKPSGMTTIESMPVDGVGRTAVGEASACPTRHRIVPAATQYRLRLALHALATHAHEASLSPALNGVLPLADRSVGNRDDMGDAEHVEDRRDLFAGEHRQMTLIGLWPTRAHHQILN